MNQFAIDAKIPVGISQCLLGDEVRYNGGHKRSRYCTDTLAKLFSYESVCPEVAIGLGTPRETIRLVGDIDHARAIQSTTPERDVTDELANYADTVAESLPDICGFILTEKSPSCGIFQSKVYSEKGHMVGASSGVFARRLRELKPLLPMEEAGRLNDNGLRENFVLRVFTYHDWQQSVAKNPSAHGIIQFYSRYKYLVMAHHQATYKKLGQLLATAGKQDPHELSETVFSLIMSALAKPSSRGNNTNVLMHMMGYLKTHLDPKEKASLKHMIEEYRDGVLPLITPLMMIRHFFLMHPTPYIDQQTYLTPYPDELGLRNFK